MIPIYIIQKSILGRLDVNIKGKIKQFINNNMVGNLYDPGVKKKDYLKSSPKGFFTKEKLDHSENQELYSLKDITSKVKRQDDSMCS